MICDMLNQYPFENGWTMAMKGLAWSAWKLCYAMTLTLAQMFLMGLIYERNTFPRHQTGQINRFLLLMPDSDPAICMSKQKLRFIRPFVNVQLFSVLVLPFVTLIDMRELYHNVLLLKSISGDGLTYCTVRDDLHLSVAILFICGLFYCIRLNRSGHSHRRQMLQSNKNSTHNSLQALVYVQSTT